MKFSSGFGRRQNTHGEFIWAGISPIGIQVIDRLENKVMILDLNLNFMHNISINQNLYPEMAQIDSWGKLFMYSNTYNGIFILENNNISKNDMVHGLDQVLLCMWANEFPKLIENVGK